jgi:hypothetical protein
MRQAREVKQYICRHRVRQNGLFGKITLTWMLKKMFVRVWLKLACCSRLVFERFEQSYRRWYFCLCDGPSVGWWWSFYLRRGFFVVRGFWTFCCLTYHAFVADIELFPTAVMRVISNSQCSVFESRPVTRRSYSSSLWFVLPFVPGQLRLTVSGVCPGVITGAARPVKSKELKRVTVLHSSGLSVLLKHFSIVVQLWGGI